MSPTPEERLAQENRRLRQDLEALQCQAQAWQFEKQAFQTQVQELESIRRNLEHTVAVYKRCLFGSRSEKIDPKQLEARIAKAAAEARQQLAKEKRPGDPPPEAEEEQPEEKADNPTDSAQPPADRPHRPGQRAQTQSAPARPWWFSRALAASTHRASRRSRAGPLHALPGSSSFNQGRGGYL